MTKKRVGIYIAGNVWQMARDSADLSGKSVSVWMEEAIRLAVDLTLLESFRDLRGNPVSGTKSEMMGAPERPEGEVLADAQEKLNSESKKRNVKKDKKVKDNLSVRDKYKIKFPNETCPKCGYKNIYCKCD